MMPVLQYKSVQGMAKPNKKLTQRRMWNYTMIYDKRCCVYDGTMRRLFNMNHSKKKKKIVISTV